MGINNKLAYLNYEGLEKYHNRLIDLVNGTIGITYVTYNQLLNLVNSNLLIPGKKYRIIDFASTGRYGWVAFDQGYFDIIVTASNPSSLESRATAAHALNRPTNPNWNVEKWELTYEIKNDTFRTETSLPYTGSITWMKDEYGNEAPLDFKNLVYRRSYLFSYVDQNGITSDISTLQSSDSRFSCLNNKVLSNLARFTNRITANYSATVTSTRIENNIITNSVSIGLEAVESYKVMSCCYNIAEGVSGGSMIRGNYNKVGPNSLVTVTGDNNIISNNSQVNLNGSNNVINISIINGANISDSTISKSQIGNGSNISSSTIIDSTLPVNSICNHSNIINTTVERIDGDGSIDIQSSMINHCDFEIYQCNIGSSELTKTDMMQMTPSTILQLESTKSLNANIYTYANCYLMNSILESNSNLYIDGPKGLTITALTLDPHAYLDVTLANRLGNLRISCGAYFEVANGDINNKVVSLNSNDEPKVYNIADLVL